MKQLSIEILKNIKINFNLNVYQIEILIWFSTQTFSINLKQNLKICRAIVIFCHWKNIVLEDLKISVTTYIILQAS